MINEKKLLRQMKQEWKETGYEVFPVDGTTVIAGRAWAVQIPNNLVPRRVLGLMVEHIGEIPTTAWRCRKDGTQATSMGMAEAILAQLGPGEEVEEVQLSTILYKGRQLWQRGDGLVMAFDPAYTALASGTWVAGDDQMYLEDEGGKVVVMAFERDNDPVILALEKVALVSF